MRGTLLKFEKSFLLSLIIGSTIFISSPVIPKNMDESEELNINDKKGNLNQESYYYLDKKIIKAVEPVLIQSSNLVIKKIKARIDTGATQSSIDVNLAKELGYTKYIGQINVVSANGIKTRPLVEINYELSGKKIKSIFTIADRKNLNYSILIGRNDLEGFLIDPIDN
jgi:hypothetical protein